MAGKRQAATAKGKAKACFELDIRIRDRFPSLPGLIVCLPPVTWKHRRRNCLGDRWKFGYARTI
jgi:hypothetical protein